MIDRYTRPEMAAIWSEQSKFAHWLNIEILATEARADAGDVPRSDLDEIKAKASFDPERIADLEKKTRHDVAAFLDDVASSVGPAARHLHYGMTSSDVLDTALALQIKDAGGLLAKQLDLLIAIVIRVAREHGETAMVARTHGIHAEPTTFGLKVAGWAFELHRGLQRLISATREAAVGKLSGVVGTYSQLPPQIEEHVCRRLGISADPSSTQVVARDRHAGFVSSLGIVAGTLERIATEIRHLARTEVREVEEPFVEGEQKGSSAMPHKRNPWRSERLTGLSRIVRSAVVPSIENIALWHERDISHSSVERVLLPDACMVLDFMIAEASDLIDGLVVYPERMKANLEASFGLAYSQSVLLAMIDAGLTRDEAYRIVQENSMRAWSTGTHLRELLTTDERVVARMKDADIEQCFDESRYLVHVKKVISRLDQLEQQ
ncbi:MAG: adenylosuccinate lyase [Actinomycetota bacterium]